MSEARERVAELYAENEELRDRYQASRRLLLKVARERDEALGLGPTTGEPTNDPAIHALKTRIMQAENPIKGGMIAGMPKIELDLSHAKRILLLIERLSPPVD